VKRSPQGLPPLLKKIYQTLLDFYGPQGWWPADSPFEVAVGAILTQNTSWQNVEKAIQNLKSKDLLNPLKLYKTSFKRLSSFLKPSGYFNIKTKRLKSFLAYLIRNYDGDIRRMRRHPLPSLRKELLQVDGIGEETCDSILLYALNKPIFVVDAYTRRIFARYGCIPEKVTYDEIQNFFMKNLVSGFSGLNGLNRIRNSGKGRITNHQSPVTIFNEYHALIVRHGKTLCKKIPLCRECPLSNIGCQFGNRMIPRD